MQRMEIYSKKTELLIKTVVSGMQRISKNLLLMFLTGKEIHLKVKQENKTIQVITISKARETYYLVYKLNNAK